MADEKLRLFSGDDWPEKILGSEEDIEAGLMLALDDILAILKERGMILHYKSTDAGCEIQLNPGEIPRLVFWFGAMRSLAVMSDRWLNVLHDQLEARDNASLN